MLGICNTTGCFTVPKIEKPAGPGQILEGYESLTPNGLFVMSGTMSVCQPISDFIATPVMDGSIIFSWSNPGRGPYCGIIICGSIVDYPSSINQGAKIYQGIGSNPVAGEISSVTLNNGFGNNIWYFSAFSYTTGSIENWMGIADIVNRSACKSMSTMRVFTFSDIFEVPTGISSIDIYMVNENSGTNITVGKNISVKKGDEFVIIIGGSKGYTYITRNEAVVGGIKRNDVNMVTITLNYE